MSKKSVPIEGVYKFVDRHLPKRSQFIKQDPALTKALDGGKPFYFQLNDIYDTNSKLDVMYGSSTKVYTKFMYAPVLIGTCTDGRKIALQVSGVQPYFEVQLPHGVSKSTFELEFRDKVIGDERVDITYTMRRRFQVFNEREFVYMVVTCATTFMRKRLIDAARAADYITAADDGGNYRLCMNRKYRYSACSWNTIRNYSVKHGVTVDDVPCYTVDIADISAHKVDLTQPQWRYLADDKSVICSWDMETYNRAMNTGTAPVHTEIMPDRNTYQAQIKLNCMVFGYVHEPKPFLQVAFSLFASPPVPGVLIILCRSVQDIIAGKIELLRSMLPDFVDGFNDGNYDWPFIRAYAEHYKMVDEFETTSVMANTDRYTGSFREHRIKLEADQSTIQVCYQSFGFLCIDVRNVFRVLMPLAEKTSLNFFLAEHKMAGKEDMPIETMNKIFAILGQITMCMYADAKAAGDKARMRELRSNPAGDFAEIVQWLQSADEYPFWGMHNHIDNRASAEAGCAIYHRNKYQEFDTADYGINVMHRDQCLKYIARTAEIIQYCVTDSVRCQELLLKRKVISDRRDFGDESFTNLSDNFYRAGGMKVRNTVIAASLLPEWNIAISNNSGVFGTQVKSECKYPGARVLPPKKGLYPSKETSANLASDWIKRCAGVQNRLQYHERKLLNYIDELREHARQSDVVVGKLRMGTTAEQEKYLDEFILYNGAAAVDIIAEVDDLDENEIVPALQAATSQLAMIASAKKRVQQSSQKTPRPRPCFGEDFSSLYPSVCMAFNLSPEKIIRDEAAANKLRGKLDPYGNPYRLHYIEFEYGLPGSTKKPIIRAWCVQYTPREETTVVPGTDTSKKVTKYDGMGIYPAILMDLFDRRSLLKRKMNDFIGPREVLENGSRGWPSAKIPLLQLLHDRETADMAKRLAKLRAADLEWLQQHMQRLLGDHERKAENSVVPKKLGGDGKPSKFLAHKITEHNNVYKYMLANWTDDITLAEYSELLDFNYNYYNSKQNTLKVFMNTFYGETGASLSPFFMVEIAGGITTGGRNALTRVEQFVLSMGYNALYGDTDSLYLTPPDHVFAEIDEMYDSGKIDVAMYWKLMIELTFVNADGLCIKIANFLFLWTFTRFLKMAYEEVLFPFALYGKKTYAGVQHQGIANLAICYSGEHAVPEFPALTPMQFKQSKSFFKRGLGAGKRGASEIMRLVVYEIIQKCFCIGNTSTMLDIVVNTLANVRQRTWDNSVFVRTAQYKLRGTKPDGSPKQGNLKVQGFVARMREFEAAHPGAGITVPEVGSRFTYIENKCAPYIFDIRGRKVKMPSHRRVEYFESITNNEYHRILGVEVEPDIDFYVTEEIIGQLTRIACYHERFDAETSMLDEELTDDRYKKIDEAAQKAAKNYLTLQYNKNRPVEYDDGKIAKKMYKSASICMVGRWDQLYGAGGKVLKSVQNVITGTEAENLDWKMRDKLYKIAKKWGEMSACSILDGFTSKYRDPYKAVVNLRPVLKSMEIYANNVIKQCQSRVPFYLINFRRSCDRELDVLQKIISSGGKNIDDEPILDEHMDSIHRMTDVITEMAAGYKMLAVVTLTRAECNYHRAVVTNSGAAIRTALRIDNDTKLLDQYKSWVDRNKFDASLLEI